MVYIIAGAAIGFFIAVVILLLYRVLCRREHDQSPYQRGHEPVIVKNGVDVKKQTFSGGKGDYFLKKYGRQETYYVNSNRKVWRAAFYNLKTGEQTYRDFVREMRIGRAKRGPEEPQILVISEDVAISGRHCRIFEKGDHLCIQDLHSRNHTYLNGNIVTDSAVLRSGDIIRVGGTRLRIQYHLMDNKGTF